MLNRFFRLCNKKLWRNRLKKDAFSEKSTNFAPLKAVLRSVAGPFGREESPGSTGYSTSENGSCR